MILLIDNYDSFVYNLARYIGQLGFQREVFRNDELSLDDIADLNPSHIIISPGPCTPNEAGICLELIRRYHSSIPILGICLGHQAIGQAFGGNIVSAKQPKHGKSSVITHDESSVFRGLDNPLTVGLYHSLAISEEKFPNELQITARSDNNDIMAVRHRQYSTVGVQFHPESVLTNQGYQLLWNFMNQECDFEKEKVSSEFAI